MGVVVYFISRPQHVLLPQEFAQLPEKPKLIDEFHQNTEIYSVSFSPVDPSLIAFVDKNSTIKLWNRNITNKPAVTFNHPDKYTSIGFSPSGKLLVCASFTLILWDVASGQKLNTLKTGYGGFTFSPDGNLLATTNNEVKLWDIRNPKHITEVATLPFDEKYKAKGWTCAVSISSDGKWIAAGYSHGTINVWDINSKQLVRTLETPYYEMNSLKFSPNNKFLITGGPVLYKDKNNKTWVSSDAKGYSMWELPSWKLRGSVQRGNIENIVFSPDGDMCVAANDWSFYGRGVEIWSTEDGAPITSLHTEAKDVSFSPDGKLLATGGRDGKVRVWELNPKQLDLTTTPSDVVRIIYCLPKDEDPPSDITTKLDKSIREVQDFYANEMERHGFGRKTFRYEADENGKLKVYIVKENEKIDYDLSNEIWIVILDKNTIFPNYLNNKLPHFGYNKTFWYSNIGNNSLQDNVYAKALEGTNHGSLHYVYTKKRKIDWRDIAHELKLAFAAFDWKYPNYMSEPNKSKRFFDRVNGITPWGKGWVKLSKCDAEWLDKSRFLNPNQPFFDKRPDVDMDIIKTDTGSPNFQITASDDDGIHQLQLFVTETSKKHYNLHKLHRCQVVNGKKNTIVKFEIPDADVTEGEIRMIDMHGNIASRKFLVKEKTDEK